MLRERTVDELPQEELAEMKQKMISFEIDKKLRVSLVQSLSAQRDKARLASLDWLNVIERFSSLWRC